ncbi:Holliday junction branch migration protein RuvA [Candidatus Saccharibacteria bacterium]|nr:Holliday junction branch migration protein RuvA [Candidatus Saccharibacteria bacterium]
MIAHIKGVVEEKFGSNGIIIDVSGVGYEMLVPVPDYEACVLGEERKFYTYHQVRENAEELYGFSSLVAKKLFELLISVQGVGPKAGIAIMSLAEAEEVRNAIANGDAVFVAKASGVGKKSAERVIVDLRDKVGTPSRYGATEVKFGVAASGATESDEALDALIALGFPLKEATAALEKVPKDLSVEERVRLALKN